MTTLSFVSRARAWARLPWRTVPGRATVAAGIYFYFLLFVANGGHAHWGDFRIPILDPPFADMLSLTTAWECDRAGSDPLHLNACDPLERPANYPRLWLALSPLGLGESATTALGLLAGLAFLLAVLWLVPRRTNLVSALVWVAAATSPAVMLGIERGNPDLILFVLLVLVVALFRRPGIRRLLAFGVLVLTAMLKLYPAFALAVLIRQPPRRALATSAAAVAAVGIYGLVTLDDIREIREVVPKYVFFSFGAQVGLQALREGLGVSDGTEWRLLAAAGLAAVAAAAAGVAWRRRRRLPQRAGMPSLASARALDAYWIGALVYVGSFATAYNWDYRLMFLLLTIPQLLRWSGERDPLMPGARLAAAGVIGTLWLSEWISGWNSAYSFEELLNWALFGYLLCGLLLTLPRWLVRGLPLTLRRAEARLAPGRAVAD